jgi:tetratricopeptide (TPR) repeat protein
MFLLISMSLCFSCEREDSAQSVGITTTDLPKLMPGLGSLHHSIWTSSPLCQSFFDQGLTLTYAFNFNQAILSFKRAAELDPKAPMPLWGLALASGPNYNNSGRKSASDESAAFSAIQKAKALSSTSPTEEKDLIEALARRFSDNLESSQDALAIDYSVAMRKVRAKYTEDPDALTLFAESLMDLHAWHLWSEDGKPGENTSEIESILEEVLRRWPDHVGANHLYLHLMETSPYPERALVSAKRLETLVPAAGHLLHMPAHIYFNCGDYAAAVRCALAATVADREFRRDLENSDVSYVVGYAQHNSLFLIAAAGMDGEFQVARDTAAALAAEARSAPADWPSEETFTIPPILNLIRFARWDGILALPEPQEGLTRFSLFWHFARGCAFAAKNELGQAEAERSAMALGLQAFPSNRGFGLLFSDWGSVREIISETLDARIAEARGEFNIAIDDWSRAIAIEDRMPYHEPPAWPPIRESLGAAFLMNGQPKEAERVFREDLTRNPLNPRSLFGLWNTLVVEGETPEAERTRKVFLRSWKNSAPLHIGDL